MWRAAWIAAVMAMAPTGLADPRADKKPKPTRESYAVVAGTVFRDTGMALPGAELTLAAVEALPGGRKFKKMSAVTNTRGEFAFQVPVAIMSYNLEVKAAGYQAQQKAIRVEGEGRTDVFFRLEPASK